MCGKLITRLRLDRQPVPFHCISGHIRIVEEGVWHTVVERKEYNTRTFTFNNAAKDLFMFIPFRVVTNLIDRPKMCLFFTVSDAGVFRSYMSTPGVRTVVVLNVLTSLAPVTIIYSVQ